MMLEMWRTMPRQHLEHNFNCLDLFSTLMAYILQTGKITFYVFIIYMYLITGDAGRSQKEKAKRDNCVQLKQVGRMNCVIFCFCILNV